MNIVSNLNSEAYNAEFFSNQVDGSSSSASTMVPWILKLVPGASSVVDVGCGTGAWLAEYERNGIQDYMGIDGHLPDGVMLKFARDKALKRDLTQPLDLGRRFDIAQSLEVAEHLPVDAANTFLDSLVDLSDVVVFGAAIPGQGGTYHINEQWQSYWFSRFEERGYVGIDALRPKGWYNNSIMWWYAQNTIVFVNSARTELVEHIRSELSAMPSVDVVHPNCFRQFRDALEVANMRLKGVYGENGGDSAHLIPTFDATDYAKLFEVLPKRFKDPARTRKLAEEKNSWKRVMWRHPLRVSYWWDLYRVQRRRERAQET